MIDMNNDLPLLQLRQIFNNSVLIDLLTLTITVTLFDDLKASELSFSQYG